MHPLLEKKNTKNQNRGLATGIATDREREFWLLLLYLV
jgi:hypothetical protein